MRLVWLGVQRGTLRTGAWGANRFREMAVFGQTGVRDQEMFITRPPVTPVPKMKLWKAAEIVSAIETGAVFQSKNLDGQQIRFSITSCDAVREVATVAVHGPQAFGEPGDAYRDEISYDSILFAEAGWPKFIEIWRKPGVRTVKQA